MVTAQSALLKHPDKFFIGEEWVALSRDSKIDVTSSCAEDLFASVAEAQGATALTGRMGSYILFPKLAGLGKRYAVAYFALCRN